MKDRSDRCILMILSRCLPKSEVSGQKLSEMQVSEDAERSSGGKEKEEGTLKLTPHENFLRSNK